MQIIVVLGFLQKGYLLLVTCWLVLSSIRQQDINGEKDTNWVLSCLTTHPDESSYEFTLTINILLLVCCRIYILANLKNFGSNRIIC